MHCEHYLILVLFGTLILISRTRLAILNELKKIEVIRTELKKAETTFLKMALPVFAFFVSTGAFRECWVKYGYDFRTKHEARFYQVVDVRVVKTNANEVNHMTRAKRRFGFGKNKNHGIANVLKQTINKSQEPEDTQTDSSLYEPNFYSNSQFTTHLFDGTCYTQRVTLFQFCDVTDPELTLMINTVHHLNNTWDKKYGW